MLRIVIADDHPLTLNGTKVFVESLGHQVLDTCSNGITAYNLINLHRPDIAILDINMPGLDGIDILEKVFGKKMETKVIILTMHKEKIIYKKALEYGVHGYLLKEHADTELGDCINAVRENRHFKSAYLEDKLIHKDEGNIFENFSLTEKKITMLVAEQKTSKQIADLLFLSEKTVEGYRSKIIEKLQLPKEKNALLKWAIRNLNP